MTTTDEITRLREALEQIATVARSPVTMQNIARAALSTTSTTSTTHSVSDREAAINRLNIHARLVDYPSGEIGFRRDAILATLSKTEMVPTVDEALRTAHQSSSTLVEYLDTPPTIGTAEQAIDYALHLHFGEGRYATSTCAFLRDWRSGDVSAWPAYLEWLSGEGRE